MVIVTAPVVVIATAHLGVVLPIDQVGEYDTPDPFRGLRPGNRPGNAARDASETPLSSRFALSLTSCL